MPEPLPQELIDAIIEEVPTSSLAACSLTATAFVTSSQRRLFRWMSLPNIPAYARAARFLAASPHLGPYFRYLALNIKEVPKDYGHLKSILGQLSEIEFLTISGDFSPSGTKNQIGQNPCLVEFLSTSTLRCFALDRLNDVPASLITRAFSLFEEVQLSFISIVDDEGQGSGSLASPELWHLNISSDIDSDQGILSFILQPKRIQSLRELQRLSVVIPPIPDSRLHRFEELLVACSENLDYLELELEAPPTFIPTLPALTYLELWLDVELTKTPRELHSIIAATLACTPNLEVLTFAILDRPDGPHRPNRQQWTSARPWAWADLDSALMDMGELCEVNFSLRWFHHEPERYTAFAPFIQTHFPRSFDAGLVCFSYRSCFEHPMDRFATIY